jgi:(p)ppGpp synthase/HD superfamily hydrolase
MENNLIEKATKIAVIAHKKQVRKTDNSPYVVHPISVAFKLMQNGFSSKVVAAALVHDVLEDTDFPLEKLREELGNDVLTIVEGVSEDKNLPWKERKQKYIESVRNGSEDIKAVSISDKIHNAKSILDFYQNHGVETWSKFSRGKNDKMWFENEMLKTFQETWDHPLIEEYKKLVDEMNSL